MIKLCYVIKLKLIIQFLFLTFLLSGVCGKCSDFLCNLYTSSKARAQFASMLSNEFPIKRGVRQGCPLYPILFNLFINDILNDCEKYGVNIGRKKCCGGLFADNVVLIAPSAKNLERRHLNDKSWIFTSR